MPNDTEDKAQHETPAAVVGPRGNAPETVETSDKAPRRNSRKVWPLPGALPTARQARPPAAPESSSETTSTSATVSEVDVSRPKEPAPKGRLRAFSDAFNSVYPQRWQRRDTIGTNPVQNLSVYHKSRLGLDLPQYDSDEEIEREEGDLEFVGRRLKEFYHSFLILPSISCFLCCRAAFKSNYDEEELELLFQPRTHNSIPYLRQLKVTLENMPERDWRGILHENLLETVTNSIFTASHLQTLVTMMDQFRTTLAFSDLYASAPVIPLDPDRLRGRSMTAAFVYMITFITAQLDRTDERLHDATMKYIRKLYLELLSESIILWASTCHIVATAEIILEDFEHVIGKYLFHVRSASAEFVNLKAKDDYNEQARVRFVLRREKKIRDERVMNHKIRWPSGVDKPPKPNLMIVSRIEDTNAQWHPFNLFDFAAQTRILVNVIKRTKNIIGDAFSLLSEFDRVLHTHRPSRKEAETETLFEDSIYLKDRFVELNTFPRNLLNETEVEWIYEVGRVLSDKLDELYISLFAAKDVARETVHVTQLCHEYLRIHEQWGMDHFHIIAKRIQEDLHKDWDHYEGFAGMEPLHTVEDPVPLFNASLYLTLIRMFPVKVAKLYLSFQTPQEARSRKQPSSHSLWDAFDTIPDPQYPKPEDISLNKHDKG